MVEKYSAAQLVLNRYCGLEPNISTVPKLKGAHKTSIPIFKSSKCAGAGLWLMKQKLSPLSEQVKF